MPLYGPPTYADTLKIGTQLLVPNSVTAIANSAAASNCFGFSGGSPTVTVNGTTNVQFSASGPQSSSGFQLGTLGSADVAMVRGGAAATLQHGAADAASPVAQIIQVQSATGTDANGANWTFKGSKNTGAGTPGNIIFQTSVKLGTGTTQGTPETGLTITGPANTSQHPSVVCGNQAIATDASDGFLYIPTCAGTPTGTPTTFTGRVPLVFDTTNSQFWIFTGGAWKQPKTPAAAAIVTWQ